MRRTGDPRRRRPEGGAWLLLVALACAEGEEPAPAPTVQADGMPRTARADVRAELLADRAAPRHAADGGGRAWIDAERSEAAPEAGGRWSGRIVYEAGPLGVAAGGSVVLQVSPFWGWSTPQLDEPEAIGFTRVSTEAEGVELAARVLPAPGARMAPLAVEIRGRALGVGERVAFDYGAGPARARADDFAERQSRFWIAVDGDGDGVREVLEDSPSIAVRPGAPALLVVHGPSVARPEADVELAFAILDRRGNLCTEVAGSARLEALEGWEPAPDRAFEGGSGTLALGPARPGTWRPRVLAALADGLECAAAANPLLVEERGPRVLWADLHGHSAESDGSGHPDDWWRYARAVADLDVAALTDHDAWGMLPLDRHPARWDALVESARRHSEPGRFLALPGYEFTDWIHGHRHVVYFGAEAPLHSSLDAATSDPAGLLAALAGRAALVVPHHPAGGPVALDWAAPLDPRLEPAVEIVSCHGSSEAADSPLRIYSPAPGHFARDALASGQRFGFLGSGDGHDGHPGLTHLGGTYPSGGLTAVLAEDLTPEAVLGAIRERRTYATSGPRILLRFSLAGARMGHTVSAGRLVGDDLLYVRAVGTDVIERVELVRGAEVAASVPGNGTAEVELVGALTLDPPLARGEFIYVRVRQSDGALAWSSPIWIE